MTWQDGVLLMDASPLRVVRSAVDGGKKVELIQVVTKPGRKFCSGSGLQRAEKRGDHTGGEDLGKVQPEVIAAQSIKLETFRIVLQDFHVASGGSAGVGTR